MVDIKRIRLRLDTIVKRNQELEKSLSASDITADMTRYRKLSKEFSDTNLICEVYRKYLGHIKNIEEAQQMSSEPEMVDIANEEINSNKVEVEKLEIELQRLLIPTDPEDEHNVFLEIRAGTGGDESGIFAGDLFRMYQRYAERMRWKLEVISSSDAEMGGFKEIIARLEGDNVYGKLKFESGGHRVQRVPETETQGRIHTSACTVAVLPEVTETEVTINPADLKIDTYRASGAGGQHVNKTDSAIRITHLPSGLVVECQEDRSQHRNRAQAMSILASRLYEAQREATIKKTASKRKLLIGSGDRSERIRTYNFPQGRLTDHRINLTLYKLAMIMDGDLADLINSLLIHNQNEILEEELVE